jgi:RNA polymerase sigma-70 factor (ECF subfamily)
LKVARNLAISESRRWGGGGASAGQEEAEVLSIPEAPPDPLLLKRIHACAEGLPPKPRQALWSRIGAKGGVADVELAELLGMTKNTFLKNFGRARALMAECLERVGVSAAAP